MSQVDLKSFLDAFITVYYRTHDFVILLRLKLHSTLVPILFFLAISCSSFIFLVLMSSIVVCYFFIHNMIWPRYSTFSSPLKVLAMAFHDLFDWVNTNDPICKSTLFIFIFLSIQANTLVPLWLSGLFPEPFLYR